MGRVKNRRDSVRAENPKSGLGPRAMRFVTNFPEKCLGPEAMRPVESIYRGDPMAGCSEVSRAKIFKVRTRYGGARGSIQRAF